MRKDIGDYHEADGLGQNKKVSAQKYNGYIKDNIIDIVNNNYARDYGKKVDFEKATSSIENYTDFLNGLAQHISSTVDGYKNDKAFDGIRNGSVKVFDKNNETVKERSLIPRPLETGILKTNRNGMRKSNRNIIVFICTVIIASCNSHKENVNFNCFGDKFVLFEDFNKIADSLSRKNIDLEYNDSFSGEDQGVKMFSYQEKKILL